MIIVAIFGAYIATAVLTGGSIFHKPRAWAIQRTPWLQPNPYHPHFLECRLCLGFWVSLIFAAVFCDVWQDAFLVYGASYFLATQER